MTYKPTNHGILPQDIQGDLHRYGIDVEAGLRDCLDLAPRERSLHAGEQVVRTREETNG
jgi:hypothetical protein